MSVHKKTGWLLLSSFLMISSAQAQVPKPPPSRVDNFREVLHGVEIIDPIAGLKSRTALKHERGSMRKTNTLTRCLTRFLRDR